MRVFVWVSVLVESVFKNSNLYMLSANWPQVYPNILQIGEGKIMPFKECRAIMTDGNTPKAYITKKNICFGGGPDGTVSHCEVCSQYEYYLDINWIFASCKGCNFNIHIWAWFIIIC